MLTKSERDYVRRQRKALLREQMHITFEKCANCPLKEAVECKAKKCPDYARLKKIGEQILGLTTAIKTQRCKTLMAELTRVGILSTATYKELKSYDASDDEIRAPLGISKRELVVWKKAHGLMGAGDNA